MKKLTKISLNDLGQAEMLKKEMSMIRGGSTDGPTEGTVVMVCWCSDYGCPCKYEGTKEGPHDDFYGGSSTAANLKSNGCSTDVSVQVVALG